MDNKYTEAAQRLAAIWTDFAEKMASAGVSFQPDSAAPDSARKLRDAMLAAMASYADEFMRTPEFLEMMKQTMQASLELRKQFNEFLTRVHHGVQGVARQDVDAVIAAIRQMETRTLDRLETLSKRLDELSRRVDAVEGGRRDGRRAGGSGSGRKAADKPKRGRSGR